MALNKQKGNMYPFVTHTWNVIKGKCFHDCSYCYMKRWKQPELYFDEKELKTDLGKDNFIFLGSSCDMWAKQISDEKIKKILEYIVLFQNRYLLQTKNVKRFMDLKDFIPKNAILATTLETNRINLNFGEKYNISHAPDINERIIYMEMLKRRYFDLMISIEPIIDFDLNDFIDRINFINPKYISIGADSMKSNLPEPSSKKVWELAEILSPKYHVVLKKNLKRLLLRK